MYLKQEKKDKKEEEEAPRNLPLRSHYSHQLEAEFSSHIKRW